MAGGRVECEPSFLHRSRVLSLVLLTRHPPGEGRRGSRVRRTGGGAKPGRSLAGRKSAHPSNHRSVGQDDAPSARPLLKGGHSEDLAAATCAGAGSSHQRTQSTEVGRALSHFGDLVVPGF